MIYSYYREIFALFLENFEGIFQAVIYLQKKIKWIINLFEYAIINYYCLSVY